VTEQIIYQDRNKSCR